MIKIRKCKMLKTIMTNKYNSIIVYNNNYKNRIIKIRSFS